MFFSAVWHLGNANLCQERESHLFTGFLGTIGNAPEVCGDLASLSSFWLNVCRD